MEDTLIFPMRRVPSLRFNCFNRGTKRVKLGDISSIRTGPFGSLLHQHDYVEVGTPIVTVEHLSDLGIVHENLPRVSDEDKVSLHSYTLSVNDIVFSRVGSVDRNSLISLKEDGWLFSGRLLRIRCNETLINPKFLSYYFQLEFTKHRIRSVAVGQTMASLNTEILKSFIVEFPEEIAEQQKIASFLSAVDEKIQHLIRKKELLEQYKKGVMQQIFSRKLRFKDENGNDYPEWEEKRLGDLGKFYGGGTPVKDGDNWVGNIPWISSSDILENDIHGISMTRFVNPNSIKNSATKLIKKGSVLFISRVGVGKLAINNCDVCTSQDFINFTPTMTNSYFLGYLFVAQKNILLSFCQGTSIKGFTKSDIENLKIPLPVIKEQDKISLCLTQIDKKIKSLGVQIIQTQTFKKGLLQQMFV